MDRPSGTRITALLVTAAIATLAIGTLSVIGSPQKPVRPLFDQVFRTQRLTRDVQRFVAAGRRYALTGDPKERAIAEGRERDLRATLSLVDRSVGQTEGGRLAIGELQRVVDAIKATVATAMRDVSAQDSVRDRDDRVARLEARLVADYTAYHQQLDAILELVDRELREFEDEEALARRTRWFVLGLAAVGFALGVGALVVLQKHLDRPGPRVRVATPVAPRDTPLPDKPSLLG